MLNPESRISPRYSCACTNRSISAPRVKELRRTKKRCLCSGDYQITVKSSIDISENDRRTKAPTANSTSTLRIWGHNSSLAAPFPTLLPNL